MAAAALAPGFAAAQLAPPATAPSVVTREELQRGERPDEAAAPRRPRLRIEDRIERAPCPLADARFASVRVTLSTVTFGGLKGGIAPELLRPAYADALGSDQPIAVVCEIRDRAATLLRSRGFLAAIQVPAQRIENGTVRFDVLLARLAAVRVRGNAGRSDALIAALLQPLTKEPVFNERDAERRLLLARDLPGFDVRLTLRPGDAPGDVIGDVTVIRTPLFADVNIQNLGSPEVGRWGGTLRAQVNGLTGLGDSTTVSFFNTTDLAEQHVLTASHSFLLGATGIGVGGGFTYAWTRPDVPGIAIDSRTSIGNFGLSYPLVRSRAATLRLSTGIDFIDQTVDLAGRRLTTDRLRVPNVRLEAEAIAPRSVRGEDRLSIVTPRWRTGGVLEVRHGINSLGASEGCGRTAARCLVADATPPSRLYGDPTAFVARLTAQGEYRPDPLLTLVAALRAQYAPDPLLSFEEFSAGNYTIGRGYDPGAIIGDKGVGFSLEVRAGRAFPTGPDRPFAQPFAFVDAVWVWNNDPPAALAPPSPQTVSSFGLGARGGFGDRIRFDLSAAIPAQRVPVNTPGGLAERTPPVRFLMSVTTRLWPWRRG